MKKRKKMQKSCRCDVGKGGNLGGKRKKRRQKSIVSVANYPDSLGIRREGSARRSRLKYELYK